MILFGWTAPVFTMLSEVFDVHPGTPVLRHHANALTGTLD